MEILVMGAREEQRYSTCPQSPPWLTAHAPQKERSRCSGLYSYAAGQLRRQILGLREFWVWNMETYVFLSSSTVASLYTFILYLPNILAFGQSTS